ncbi:hypothetical protein SGM_4734 [Streptomyces griseoaurantiacus M045]|uniref:Uncharacterized protein n=1 Tax=Streptomyces griseoaurantiacus M045 TaxID=996637 RepID=F3NNM0_9ACTN|nr:hypothetical protein SGM_4734 [Streptomyces griseoaurantiacus M045]
MAPSGPSVVLRLRLRWCTGVRTRGRRGHADTRPCRVHMEVTPMTRDPVKSDRAGGGFCYPPGTGPARSYDGTRPNDIRS